MAGAADLAAGPGRGRASVAIAPEVIGYVVDLARATRSSPSLQLGRLAARRDRAAVRRPGLGLAVRPRLRHARRRQGAGPAALRHRVELRPEAELEGVTPDAVLDGVLGHGAGPALSVT